MGKVDTRPLSVQLAEKLVEDPMTSSNPFFWMYAYKRREARKAIKPCPSCGVDFYPYKKNMKCCCKECYTYFLDVHEIEKKRLEAKKFRLKALRNRKKKP